MAKALRTIGMIAGAIAMVVPGLQAVGAIAMSAATAGTVAAVASGVAAAANIGSQLAYKPPPARGSLSQIIIDPNAPQPYVMGEGYCAGVLRHRTAYGATLKKVPNPYQFLAVVYSGGGPIDSITPYVDQAAVSAWYTGFLYTDTQLGACPEADALAPQWAGTPGWSSTSKLSGQAAIGWSLKFDKDGKVFASGVPQLGAYGKWVKAYDPRKDSTRPGGSGSHRLGDETTYEWTERPALHAGTYAYGRYQNGKRTIGCGLPDEAIDWSSVAAWANVCDANDWKIFGAVYEPMPETRWPNLKDIAAAGGARPLLVAGVLTFHVAAPRTALDTFTEDDLGAAPGSVTAMKGRRERINTIVPKYRDPAQNWELVPAAPLTDAGYLAEDGEERKVEWPFNLVKHVDQAAQLGAYTIADARELQPIVLTFGERVRAYRPGDCVHLDVPRLGLDTDAVILSREFDPAALTTTFTFIGETPAKHSWALTRTGSAPATPAIGQSGADRDALAFAAGKPAGWQSAAIRLAAVKNPRDTSDVPRALLTAATSGGSSTISVARHDWDYPDGTADVTRELDTVTGLSPATTYYVYFDDADLTDTSPIYAVDTDLAEAQNSSAHPDRHPLGKIVTPATAAPPTEGGPVPGYGYLALAEDGAPGLAGGMQARLSKPFANVLADKASAVTSYTGASGTVLITDATGADISSNFALSAGSNPQALTIGYAGMAYSVTAGFDAGETAATVEIIATGSGTYAGVVLSAGTFTLGKNYPALLDSWVNANEDNGLTPDAPAITVQPFVAASWDNGNKSIRLTFTLAFNADPTHKNSIDGFEIVEHRSTGSGSYAFNGSDLPGERTYTRYLLPGTATGTLTFDEIVNQDAPANLYYQYAVYAIRTVNKAVDASGVKRSSAAISTTPFRPATSQNWGGTVGGAAAGSLASMFTSWNAGNSQNGSTVTAPTTVAVSTATFNSDSTADIAVSWAYTPSNVAGAGANIDGFRVGLWPGTGNITYNPATHDSGMDWKVLPRGATGVKFTGKPADRFYTAVVIAARSVDANINTANVLFSAAAQNATAHRPTATPNSTVDVNGTPATNVSTGVVRALAAINGSNNIDTAKVLTGSIASNNIDVSGYANRGSSDILFEQVGGDTTTQTFSGADITLVSSACDVEIFLPIQLRKTDPVNNTVYSVTMEIVLYDVTVASFLVGSPVWTLLERWQQATVTGSITKDLTRVIFPLRWRYTGLTAGHTVRPGYKFTVTASQAAVSLETKYVRIREPRAST